MSLKIFCSFAEQKECLAHAKRKNYDIINKMLIGKASTGEANNKNFKILIAWRQTIVF